jgi:hypothetical protein
MRPPSPNSKFFDLHPPLVDEEGRPRKTHARPQTKISKHTGNAHTAARAARGSAPTKIRWEDPPEPSVGRGRAMRVDAFVAGLKRHPGRWALVGEGTPGLAGPYRLRGCEVAVRGPSSGLRKVYARWPEPSK